MNGGATATARCGSISAAGGSPRIALMGEFGSDEFHAAYARGPARRRERRHPTQDRATGQRHAGGTDRVLQAGRRLPAICGKPRRRATCRGSTRSSASMARVRWRASTKSGSKPCWPPMTTGPQSKLDTLKKLRILIKHAHEEESGSVATRQRASSERRSAKSGRGPMTKSGNTRTAGRSAPSSAPPSR